MLKLIHPLISPELLHALASMGHGDEVAIVDANFPATTLAKRLVIVPGASTPALLEAILTLLPTDTFVPEPGWTMEIVGDPTGTLPVIEEMKQAVAKHDDRPLATLERHAFYAHTKDAFVVVQSGETRKYGNIILKKGVISTD
jgi:L-fucose mutarotase